MTVLYLCRIGLFLVYWGTFLQ
ncbi:hypothetical protein LINGRAHAP2_LOCUS6459 [Linum grandiflorum]